MHDLHSEDMQIFSHLQTLGNQDEQNDVLDFPQFGKFLDNMLPKSKKENLNALGQRKPLQPFQLDAMYRTPFKVEQFIKLARIYYQANYDRRHYITMHNEVTNKAIRINLNQDEHGYIKVIAYLDSNFHKERLTVEFPQPKYNQDLFKKLLTKKLI